jgi:predicted XRE-type DNA-binding protein
MTSFQITLSPNRRAAARYVTQVRRALQKALAEEQKASGLTQSQIARAVGVHRSVINREMRGQKDLTLGRVAELAWAMGRKPIFELVPIINPHGSNLPPVPLTAQAVPSLVAKASTNCASVLPMDLSKLIKLNAPSRALVNPK